MRWSTFLWALGAITLGSCVAVVLTWEQVHGWAAMQARRKLAHAPAYEDPTP